MKKIILMLMVVISTITAQNFTGTIIYSNTDTGEVMKYFIPYIPSHYRLYFNQSQVAMDFQGGMFNGVRFTFPPGKKEAAVIIDSLKIYTTIGPEEAKEKKKIVEKLPETEVILGHGCIKYKITEDDSVYKNTYYVWIANDMAIATSGLMQEVGGELFLNNMPYAVLKMETTAGLHYEATSILTTVPDPDIFKIPKGYKLEKKLFRKVEEKKEK